MKMFVQRIAPLSLGLLLLMPGVLSAGVVNPPDIGGPWGVSTGCTLRGEEAGCVYEGTGQVTQNGDQVMGTVQLMLVSGPASCPAEMMADLQGTLQGSFFFGTLDGGQALGVLDFDGDVSGDAQMIAGSFTVRDGGPFQGCAGAFDAQRLVLDVEIPTLSGVSLTILLLLLVGAGLIMLRRRASVA